MSGLEDLLQVIATAASERRPLPEALRASGLAGAQPLADALATHGDLRRALADRLDPRHLDLLAGPRPPLEQSALLVAHDLRRRRETRAAWIMALAQPLATVAAMVAALVVIGRHEALAIGGAGWLAAIPGLFCLVLPLAGLLSERVARLLPWLCGWKHHARRADRFSRAALAARWRLPEAGLVTLLGADVLALGPVLASPGAENHCRRLADYHRERAAACTRRATLMASTGCLLIAGAILLTALSAPIDDLLRTLDWLGDPEAAGP